MIEYDGSKCTPHGQTRCAICQAMAAKGRRPSSPEMPPPSIAGGPPPDIEGLGNVRDREPKTVEEANTDYDKILAEVEQMRLKPDAGMIESLKAPSPFVAQVAQPGQVNTFARDAFATLPTDDSHASKVLRAAAAFASAAQAWAQELAYVEKIKKVLLTAEMELDKVTINKNVAEIELKKLVAGE
jgi:hypothetical protein